MNTPLVIQKVFPSMLWKVKTDERKIYLTFDDGPIPEVTPEVLSLLKQYNAKATFFCIGDNVRKHPDIFKEVIAAGHTIGNHTMHHLNGWKNRNIDYFRDVIDCSKQFNAAYFRPPYGKIRLSQARSISKKYRIVMWDVLSKDYDKTLTGKEVLQRVISGGGNGSIVVFHDSLKAYERLKYALPATLEHFSSLGYRFEAL